MHKTVLTFTSFLTLTGCHAKFKKYAPTLGEVRSEVVDTGVPYVQLGSVYVATNAPTLNLAAAVINTVQAVKSVDQTQRVAKAVNGAEVAEALVQGVAETLRQGPPFAITEVETSPLLQVRVESYGLSVPYLGAAGVFTYDMRADIYLANGERVYTNHVHCATDAMRDDPVSEVLGAVNNVRKLDQMSDEEINAAFVDIGRFCGAQLVIEMRKHAS